MKKHLYLWVTLSASALSFSATHSALAETKGKLEETWNLSALYASDALWQKSLTEAEPLLRPVSGCKGQWAKSKKQTLNCFDAYFKAHKEIAKLSNYAFQKVSGNGEDAAAQAMKGQATKLWAKFQESSSSMESEIIAMPIAKFRSFRDSPELKSYRMTLDNIARKRDHTLSAKENEILAYSSELAEGSREVFHALTTLNLPYQTVKLSSGESVEINAPAFSKYRQADNADDRDKVFRAFFGTYKNFRETYAANFNSMVNRDAFYRKALKYGSDVEAALDSTNVPVSVYTKMIEEVRANRPLLWRYLKLKQKMLGLKELKYSDLYLPLTKDKAPQYSFEDSKKISREALSPLGADYQAILDKAHKERWMDVYPRKGKVSGAYMDGSAYDVHPFVLLNHNDDYESLSTYIHEFGHAAHSYYAMKAQPYHLSNYPIFAAEVASTFNEVLLSQHLQATSDDPKLKLFFLGQVLEGFRTTVFRQAFFADFEWTVHELSQKGQTLTADLLDKTYLDLLKLYYGDQEGVVKIDPLYAIEWAYIPHFYNNFYVFQYTTSFISSNALAAKVLAEGDKARDSYIAMLKAGGSLYPLDLLKLGGVDMSGTEPYKIAFASMEKALAEAEKIADQLKK